MASASVEIHITGNAFSASETTDWIVKSMREALSQRDVLIDTRSARPLTVKIAAVDPFPAPPNFRGF
jgi:hypothetical protein